MDLNDLILSPLTCQKAGYWEGEKGIAYLVHALSHSCFLTFLSTLFVFLLFFFLTVFSLIPSHFLSSFLLTLFPSLLCMAKAFLYYLPWWVLLFYPSTTFGLVWVSFLGHTLVCRPLSQHHYLTLATPCSIPRQRSSCFIFLSSMAFPSG